MKHKIEFDKKCESCGGSGAFSGFGESKGSAVVCRDCKGSGKVREVITYEDFEGKVERFDVKRIFPTNIGWSLTPEDLTWGMDYHTWFMTGKMDKREDRIHTCPAHFYQCLDYDRKPDWNECIGCGQFSECRYFSEKEKCWQRFDKEKK